MFRIVGYRVLLTLDLTTHKPTLSKLLQALLLLSLLSTAGIAQIGFLENGRGTHRGPDGGIFLDTPTRTKIDLSGPWKYSLDGKEWFPVLVPSAYDVPAQVVFQRTFEMTPEMLDAYTFFFVAYGINYQADISINGSFVGRHVGGYSTFALPISENVLQVGSENVVRISVKNQLTVRSTLPLRHPVGGWRSYGGITRDIYILAVPKLFVADVQVTSELAADFKWAKLRVLMSIENHGFRSGESGTAKGETFALVVEAYDRMNEVVVGRSAPVHFTVGTNKATDVSAELALSMPKLWSPDTPDLYTIRCFVMRVVGREFTPIDQYDVNYGIRNVMFRDGGVFVNGNHTTLKGVVWREDHPTFGAAMTYEALEKDIVQIKGLGANLVRFLYPPHPYMLNLCARYGLFAMIEIPLVGVPSEIVSTDDYQELVTTYIREMVQRDRNHVAVLAWGIGDEFDPGWSGPHPCKLVGSMKEFIGALDARPAYYATRLIEDPCASKFTLLTVNTDARDAKELRHLLTQWKEKYPSKPIIVARYGKAVQPENRKGYSDSLSEEAQARHIMQQYDVMKELRIAGSVLWSFNDWRGDRPALSALSGDPYLHTMGVVSFERQKRVSYEVLRSLFKGEKIAALPVGNYSAAAPMIYVVTGLIVLIAFAFLYNNNRRFRENVNRSLSRTYNFFADVRDQRILSNAHTFFLAFVIAVTLSTVFSSVLTHYRDNHLLDNLLSQVLVDSLKEWFVFLVWDPPKFILEFSGLILLAFIVLMLLVKLCAMMIRVRVSIYHAVSITIWSLLPFIALIPVAMILFRVLETPMYIIPSFALVGLLTLWAMYRLLKGVSIIYDVVPMKVYAAGVLIILGGLALAYGYLDYTQSTSIYIRHLTL